MGKGKKYSNNKGSTIIIVLVAVSFITILATLALTMSAANVKMKSIERKSKENFYSAEMALDELKANLESELGELVKTVYTDTMITYSEIPLGERNYKFKTEFLTAYLKKYASNGALEESINLKEGSSSYNFNILKELLVKTKDYTDMDNIGENVLEWKFDSKDKEQQYVYFRNVTLHYTGENNYVSRIVTDIKITIPDVNLESISNMPPFTEYSLIANTRLLVNHASAGIVGNLYAGAHGILVEGSAAKLSILADQVISRESIRVTNGAALYMQDQDGNDEKYSLDVWANNIETETTSVSEGFEPSMDLNGNFYIADDTTLNAPNSKVNFSGSYYGYGYGDSADKSSAMILNYNNCTLDLTKIVNLFIAGHAYVEPAAAADGIFSNNAEYASTYVKTGEAISTKGNQAIYRLPDECIQAGCNPVPVEEYQKLLDAGNTAMVDVEYVLPFSNKKLREYVNENQPYRMIFDQVNESTYVYFYPNFKDDYAANQYFQDYYNSSDTTYMQTLLERMKEYGTTVLAPSNFDGSTGRKTYAGNALFYNAGSEKFELYRNSVDAKLPQQFVTESKDLANMYQAYCTKLLPSLSGYLESELQKYDNLFDQLVVCESLDASRPGLKELLEGSRVKEFTNAAYGSFLLADNEIEKLNDTVFDEENALKVDGSISDAVQLIVATGDVYVERDFTGLIICKGMIRIKDGVTVTSSPQTVFQLVGNTQAKTVFRDYNSFANYLTTTNHEEIRIGELITTENWRKE
ncbi:MAG: hypothetical protein Q4F05_05235 [bacterium]|nr:hypothetical protein [bacterium]